MELLSRGARKDWKAGLDPRLIRTGCRDLWDAIMWGFRDYRESMPDVQKKMVQEKFHSVAPTDSVSSRARWETFERLLYDEYRKIKEHTDAVDDDGELFFFLINPRLIETELSPYIRESLENDWDTVENEIVDKCRLLAEQRVRKKLKNQEDREIQDVREIVTSYLRRLAARTGGGNRISYDHLQKACAQLEYHVILISPNEKVLFDSSTWKEGIPGSEYWDTILVVAHPNDAYDSLGRSSFTKENHQKISRLFRNDDILIETLRKKLV